MDGIGTECSGGVNSYFIRRPPHAKLGVGIPMTSISKT